MGLWLLMTGRTLAAGGLVTTVATMGDTTSSAMALALDISAGAIPLADSMQEDSTVVADFMAAAVTDRLR